MEIAFLYPTNLLYPNQVDENFKEEYEAAKTAGLSVYLFDVENILHNQVIPPIAKDTQVIYRGWMLSEASYDQLEQRFGKQLLTSKEAYYNAHYFPNWYEAVKSLTIPLLLLMNNMCLRNLKSSREKHF